MTTPPVPEARNDPNNDDEQENREPRTEEQRQQRERSNAGNQDDERTEGEVMAVRCSAGPIDDPVGWMDDGKDTPYVMRRRWDYFVANLQGNIPPKEYRIGAPRPAPATP